MNLAQIIEALPPRVYLRSGELVIHFSTPGDLASRIAETQAAFSGLERPILFEPIHVSSSIRIIKLANER